MVVNNARSTTVMGMEASQAELTVGDLGVNSLL